MYMLKLPKSKTRSLCLLNLLRPKGKIDFSELARQFTMWTGKWGINKQGITAFIGFSLLTFIFQQAQRFCRNSPQAYIDVCSALVLTQPRSLQMLKYLQKLWFLHIEAITEASLIFLVWKRYWP